MGMPWEGKTELPTEWLLAQLMAPAKAQTMELQTAPQWACLTATATEFLSVQLLVPALEKKTGSKKASKKALWTGMLWEGKTEPQTEQLLA